MIAPRKTCNSSYGSDEEQHSQPTRNFYSRKSRLYTATSLFAELAD